MTAPKPLPPPDSWFNFHPCEPTMPLCPAHNVPFCQDCTEDCERSDLVLERIRCSYSGIEVARWVHRDGIGCRLAGAREGKP